MKVEAERVSHPPTRVRRLRMRKLIVGLTLAFAFAMNATGQTEKILFKFTGGRDGGNPEGGLIFRGGNFVRHGPYWRKLSFRVWWGRLWYRF
jgi:hypothetical protein